MKVPKRGRVFVHAFNQQTYSASSKNFEYFISASPRELMFSSLTVQGNAFYVSLSHFKLVLRLLLNWNETLVRGLVQHVLYFDNEQYTE